MSATARAVAMEGPRRRAGARPGPGTVTLTRRRVFILPTRQGVMLGAALLVMLVGSANYNNGLGYLLTFLLAGLALVSLVHTYRNLGGLHLAPGRPAPVFAGGRADFPVIVDNRAGPARHAVVFRHRPDAHDEALVVRTVTLAADAPRRLTVPAKVPRRGRQAFPEFTIASRYPFGLFRGWSRIRLGGEVLVYPRPAGSHQLPASETGARREGSAAGRGREDFSGFRDYRPGDSPRRIHWKAVARGHGVPVKLFSGASAADLEIRWEDAPQDDTEARLSQLCRWVIEADAASYRYTLRLPGGAVGPAVGPGHRDACLAALALHGEGKR